MRISMKCTLPGLLTLLSLILCVNALYEDQIKKFDWRKTQIGALRQANLVLNTFQPRLLVSTHENVIASLCPKTGEIIWRQVLESGERGHLQLFQTTTNNDGNENGNTAAARLNSNHGSDLLTVHGYAPALVRGWNANTGVLEWEWYLMPLKADQARNAFLFYSNTILYHVIPIWGSHFEITEFFATSGQTAGKTSFYHAPWISADNCLNHGSYFTCVNGLELTSVELTASQPNVYKRTLPEPLNTKMQALEGSKGVLIINRKLVSVEDDVKTCNNIRSDTFIIGNYKQRRVIATANVINDVLNIQGYYAESCELVNDLIQNIPYSKQYGRVYLKSFDCKLKRNNDAKDCIFILSTEDEAILAVQQEKLHWIREESLANIVATEFIDLPLSDTEGTLEKELKGNSGDIASAFARRVTTQILQIKSIFLHVIGLGPPPTDTQKAGLVRDAFGLHKMLVVLTRSGKIFGIDSINGKLHWQLYLENVVNFSNGENMKLLIQRTSKHFPLQPLCTIIAKDKLSGNGVLYRFNPITGKPSEGGLLNLNYKIKQLSLLAETETDFIKGVLILKNDNSVDVYPPNTKEKANGIYLYTANKQTSIVDGYYVTNKDEQLKTIHIWNVNLSGLDNEQQIIAVAGKNPIENVHSQGRVLVDRSVLYKYINPNLVAFVTQANDNIHKYVLNLYLIDVVSGFIVFSMNHRKVRGPLQIVHSENWLAYSYYNDKVRRTEITTIELYEGKTQANSSVFSSLNAPQMPMVERQSYIIPAQVETMRETITERGITNKDVLIGTSAGAIIEMPWAFLDPRRPISSTTNGREEGAIPYIPELPLPTESTINYNQTIARLKNIHTAPSGLESTCLVVASGLDLFVTRVAPSKTFDLLKEDFDYILITIVLIILTGGSLVVKYLASRKQLKQAWK